MPPKHPKGTDAVRCMCYVSGRCLGDNLIVSEDAMWWAWRGIGEEPFFLVRSNGAHSFLLWEAITC